MKNYLLSAFVLVMGVLSAQTLTNDPAHSKLGFSANHLTISQVEGNFKDFKVTLNFTKEDLSDAKFTVTAKIASIDTGVEARDNHLKSADFFDAEKYPELKFVSTSFKQTIGSEYVLEGDLTLHGVTKKVKLKAFYNGSVVNGMSGETTHGFTIKGKINKNDFGVGTGFREAVVGNQITILSNLEFPVKK
ncbi:MAG: YceI family protein [Moheibacter sp.]